MLKTIVRITLVLLVGLGLSTAVQAGRGNKKEHKVRWTTAGASHHTPIDLDGTGSPASFIVGHGNGTFGPASVQGMFEPIQVPLDQCPEGAWLEFHAVAGTTVRTFQGTLDQVFIKTVSSLACIFLNGTVTSVSQAVITGGTGRFENATGHLTTTTLPETVSFPEWQGEFNNVINVAEGVLIFAD